MFIVIKDIKRGLFSSPRYVILEIKTYNTQCFIDYDCGFWRSNMERRNRS